MPQNAGVIKLSRLSIFQSIYSFCAHHVLLKIVAGVFALTDFDFFEAMVSEADGSEVAVFLAGAFFEAGGFSFIRSIIFLAIDRQDQSESQKHKFFNLNFHFQIL